MSRGCFMEIIIMRDNQVKNQEQVEFWQLVIESYQASGLTIKDFCRQEGLAISSYYLWRKKLANTYGPNRGDRKRGSNSSSGKSARANKAQAFLEVAALANSTPSSLTISFPGDISISATTGCDVELFCHALKILSGRSC